MDLCSVPACGKQAAKRGLCDGHTRHALTRTQAARFLGTSYKTLRRLLRDGHLMEHGELRCVKSLSLPDLEKFKSLYPKGVPEKVVVRKRKPMAPEICTQRLAELRAVAQSRGGDVLTAEYVNCSTKMLFRCAKGHEWWALPSNVKCKKRHWCKQCFYTSLWEKRRASGRTWTKKGVTDADWRDHFG